jgi:hypothetical protein
MKRPSTKQYVESLKTHIEDLDAYVTLLESKLAKYEDEHGVFAESDLYSRPVMSSFLPSTSEAVIDEEGRVDVESTTNSDWDTDIGELVVPTKHLIVSAFMTKIMCITISCLRCTILASRFRSSAVWPDVYFLSRIKASRS